MAQEFARAVFYGLELAFQYNPLAALVGATIAAALLAPRDRVMERRIWAASALVIAWLVGDGLRVIARSRDVYDGHTLAASAGGSVALDYTAIVAWAVVGLLVGYALPTWAGAFVGRRVTHGTGWLAAASIAIAASLALTTLVALTAG